MGSVSSTGQQPGTRTKGRKGDIRAIIGAPGRLLLASDPEWLIGIGRLVTALFAVVAMYLDPTHPIVFRQESEVTLGLYVFFALLIVLFPLRRPLDSMAHLVVHAVDIAVLGWLAALTNELTSPFLSFLPFILLAATIRWGLAGAILGAIAMEGLLIVVGLPDLRDGDAELDVLITRSAYFVVAAVMLGYFGAYRERSRQRLAQLAAWPFDAITGNREHWLGSLFQHAADVLGDPDLVVLWRDHDKPEGSLACWREGRLSLTDISDRRFWAKHDPEAQRHQDRYPSAAAHNEELNAILLSLPESAAKVQSPIRYACSAAFSSVRYRGRVFVINPACQPDECISLTEIIAARLGSELERLDLMQQTADAARSQERVRLARDLHDSILQDLTAASLKLKMIANTVPDDAKSQLGSVNMMVFDQQRRIRKFVEDRRSSEGNCDTTLSFDILNGVELLRQQWDCLIDFAVDPPDFEIPNWMSHEISQIISEATANAVRHGGATEVGIRLVQADHGLDLSISDNGSGMVIAGAAKRPLSLTARVSDLGGHLSISRFAPGLGLFISLPLERKLH